jgi:hypothetical protein
MNLKGSDVDSALMWLLLLFIPAGWVYLLIVTLLPPKDDDDRQD